jgi:hypothetical protein
MIWKIYAVRRQYHVAFSCQIGHRMGTTDCPFMHNESPGGHAILEEAGDPACLISVMVLSSGNSLDIRAYMCLEQASAAASEGLGEPDSR